MLLSNLGIKEAGQEDMYLNLIFWIEEKVLRFSEMIAMGISAKKNWEKCCKCEITCKFENKTFHKFIVL